MPEPRPVEFRGSALDDLRTFPASARRAAGHQPIGQGVQEIRIRDAAGAFRVIYVARFADAVHVLHCFRKKTQRTAKADLDLGERRYRDLLKERGR